MTLGLGPGLVPFVLLGVNLSAAWAEKRKGCLLSVAAPGLKARCYRALALA